MASDEAREIAHEVAESLRGEISNTSGAFTQAADSYVENLRLMERSTGSWFDPEEFKNLSVSMTKELSSYSFEESAAFMQEFMNEFAMRDMKQSEKYMTEIAAQVKAFDVSMSEVADIVWADSRSNYEGKLLKFAGNISGNLEDVKDLNVKASNILSAVNEHIEGIQGISGGNEAITEGAIRSVAALQAVEDSTTGTSGLTETLKEWSDKSVLEIQQDDRFSSMASLTGMSAETMAGLLRSGRALEVLEAARNNIAAMGGGKENYAGGNADTISMGYDNIFDSTAEVMNLVNAGGFEDAVKDAEKTVFATDLDELKNTINGEESSAQTKEQETVSPIQEWMNHFSANPLAVEIAGLSGQVNLSFTDLLVFKTVYDIMDSVVLQPLLSKFGSGFAKLFGGAVGKGTKGASKFFGIMSKLPGVGKAAESISKPMTFLKDLPTIGKGLGKLGGIVSKAGKIFLPLQFVGDAISGLTSTKEWTNADSLTDYLATGVGALLGGSGGIGSSDGIGGIILNGLFNSLKGAAIGGAFAGPAGALVGGIITAFTGVIGGKQISRFFDWAGDKISGLFESMLGGIWNGVKSFAMNSPLGWIFSGAKATYNAATGNSEANEGGGVISSIGNFIGSGINRFTSFLGLTKANPYAEGDSFVSNDGLAFLHEGEAVLTRNQADIVRDGADGGLSMLEKMSTNRMSGMSTISNSAYMKKSPTELLYEIYRYSALSYGNAFEYTEYMKNAFNESWLKYVLKYVRGKSSKSSSSKKSDSKEESSGSASFSDTGEITKDIYNYFKDLGFTDEGIAGILGNMKAESGLNPKNIQDSYESAYGSDSEYTSKVDSGSYANFANDAAGYGLVQFTNSSYKKQLLEAAKAAGKSVSDTGVQLGVFVQQLKEVGIYDQLKNATSASDAADLMLTQYERPAVNNFTDRRNNANAFLNEIKGYAVGSPWVPEDQLALIHQGEMIVPADVNPYNSGGSVTSPSGNDDVVDVLKWQVSRLESKLDRLISAIYETSSTRQRSTRAQAGNSDSVRALSPLSNSDYVYNNY